MSKSGDAVHPDDIRAWLLESGLVSGRDANYEATQISVALVHEFSVTW